MEGPSSAACIPPDRHGQSEYCSRPGPRGGPSRRATTAHLTARSFRHEACLSGTIHPARRTPHCSTTRPRRRPAPRLLRFPPVLALPCVARVPRARPDAGRRRRPRPGGRRRDRPQRSRISAAEARTATWTPRILPRATPARQRGSAVADDPACGQDRPRRRDRAHPARNLPGERERPRGGGQHRNTRQADHVCRLPRATSAR